VTGGREGKIAIPGFFTFTSSSTENWLSEMSNRNNTPRVTKNTFVVFEITFGDTISISYIGC
jgi:hypothetical protein